ncbi:MAG: glycosyltransferase family 39 protein [Bacteroidota bacterium]
MKDKNTSKDLLQLSILLGVIAFLIYANTLKNNYVLDDFDVISKNTIVTKGVSGIPEILTTPYRHGVSITSNDLYRPLSLVMFAAEYQLVGANPTIGHLMNILLFAGCVMLLFLFIYQLFERKNFVIAFITALLFALHPVHTEVVANIKSRDEILCFFFSFISLNLVLKYLDTGKLKYIVLCGISFLAALISKETAITLILIIPLIGFLYHNNDKKKSLYITVSNFTVAIIFLIIRTHLLSVYHANNTNDVAFFDNMLVKSPSVASKLATIMVIMGQYIKLLIVPYPLVCDYSFNSIPFTSLSNPWVIISIGIYICLIVMGILRMLQKRKDPLAFSILFFFITISLFSNIIFLMGTPMAERFLFFPSVGFCLAIAVLIDRWVLRNDNNITSLILSPKLWTVLIPIVLMYSVLSIKRNADWVDNATLFKADVAKAPNNAKLAYYYGTELNSNIAPNESDINVREQTFREGIAYLQRAVAILPRFEVALTELGNSYFQLHQLDSAEYYNSISLTINPKNSLTLYNQAGVYFSTKRYILALETCRKAIVHDPQWVEPYSSIAICFLQLDQTDSAFYYLYKGISINPDYKSPYATLALAYQYIGKPDSAKKYDAIAATK